MTKETSIPKDQTKAHPFDLEERTLKFSKEVITFVSTLPYNNLTRSLIDQFIRSGTSIGANYAEANEASSKKDFINKIYISKKEAKETQYWLKLMLEVMPTYKSKVTLLLEEAKELNLIFAAIIRKSQDS